MYDDIDSRSLYTSPLMYIIRVTLEFLPLSLSLRALKCWDLIDLTELWEWDIKGAVGYNGKIDFSTSL